MSIWSCHRRLTYTDKFAFKLFLILRAGDRRDDCKVPSGRCVPITDGVVCHFYTVKVVTSIKTTCHDKTSEFLKVVFCHFNFSCFYDGGVKRNPLVINFTLPSSCPYLCVCVSCGIPKTGWKRKKKLPETNSLSLRDVSKYKDYSKDQ